MRPAGYPSEAKVGEMILEAIEGVMVFDDDCHVGVVGHAGWPRVKEEFRDQRTHNAERDTQFAKASRDVGHHRDQEKINARHSPES